MKWKILALLLLLAWALALPARAAQPEEILEAQEEALDVEGLERAAEESGSEIGYGTGLEEGLEQILDTGSREIAGVVRRAVRSGVLILLVLLVCGVAESLQRGLSRQEMPAAAGRRCPPRRWRAPWR